MQKRGFPQIIQKMSVSPISVATADKPKRAKNLLYNYGLDVLLALALGFLLYHGLFGQSFSDVPIYACYALAFWGGLPAAKALSWSSCSFLSQPQSSLISNAALVQWLQVHHWPGLLIQFVAGQSSNLPLHQLPYEYPLPALIPFSLPLLFPGNWYLIAFAISMSLVAVVIYGLLRIFRSRWAAVVCALYLVVGGWATADGRFDLVPSALTLVAVILGARKRWNWAFAFLALATVFKYYPFVLLIPFLLDQQIQAGPGWRQWRRFAPLATFVAICAVVMGISLSLSIENTLAPLQYYGNRPFQVESPAASLLWLSHLVGAQLDVAFVYGSFSLTSPLAPQVSLVNTILLTTGLISVGWLQWRGKINLATAALLTLLIVMFTGKVFSPQYLLWVLPLIAYVGKQKWRWVIPWTLLAALTTAIFPYLYTYMYTIQLSHLYDISSTPLFYTVIALRNLTFLCAIVWLLVSSSRKPATQPSWKKHREGTPVATMSAHAATEEQDSPDQPLLLWHKIALGIVLVISATINFFGLSKQDFFEYYYAAAVKSMLMNWHAFFFASFDPAGILAIDKPPLGFWMQVLSARLFGYSVLSILLPGALAGVIAVALLFHLVRRVFGPVAGLIAALVLALSPINIVTQHSNIIDSLLVLAVLLAAWMVSKATETGRLRWLCLCAVLIGLGFNIKYLQAYMVIPAFGLVYLSGSAVRWRTKICHLALALGILLLVSLSWATFVDLAPTQQRPHVDSTSSNSELDLAFGYNGTFRLTADNNVVNTWEWELGRPGILRFFAQPVAGQASWLLPLALLGTLALVRQRKWRLPLDRQQQALMLWGTWLLTLLIFFSNAHFFHLYYLSMLAPANAALVGAGMVFLWQEYPRLGQRGRLLPFALLATGIFQACLLMPFSPWNTTLATSIVGCCSAVWCILLLIHHYYWYLPGKQSFVKQAKAGAGKRRIETSKPVERYAFRGGHATLQVPRPQRLAALMTAMGLLSLLLAPTVWSVIFLNQDGRLFPIAGPPAPQEHIPALIADPTLEKYLLTHQGKARFLLATMNTEAASPFIIDTGRPVMALGGYSGDKSFVPRTQLVQQIDQGLVRFFLLPGSNDQAASWVISHCRTVPTNQWQSRSTARFSVDGLPLYDCAGHS